MQDIFQADPMRQYVAGPALPGPEVQTDDEWESFLRAAAWGAPHAVGTCKLGAASDPRAVVDPQLRVCGVQGLRVVDASVMPLVTSGNTNAPTIMIVEKASEMILTG